MFTGIIQNIGRLEGIKTGAGAGKLEISCSWDTSLVQGESVCIQGVCLTVRSHNSSSFICDVLDETFAKTNLASKKAGDSLNLERAIMAGDRFGGHFVTGHVDGIGKLITADRVGGDLILTIECSREIIGGVVKKGSIACDGVSLTVTDVSDERFCVKLIPFTLDHTTLGRIKIGQSVNIETDMLGKYARLYSGSAYSKLSINDIAKAGFV